MAEPENTIYERKYPTIMEIRIARTIEVTIDTGINKIIIELMSIIGATPTIHFFRRSSKGIAALWRCDLKT